MVKVVCNFCGKELIVERTSNGIDSPFVNLSAMIPFGGTHDGEKISIDMCGDCLDKFLNTITPMCKYSPVKEFDYDY